MGLNHLWAELLVEELIRCGVTHFCIAPGSRSTPLTMAAAAHPRAHTVVHYDERGTAFFALGYARATGRPAAWITTSGTALANGYPAIIEAATDGVPMLLLTADRPPELRQTGANQTIDQVKLFGDAVRWFFDLPAPTEDIDPAFVLTTVDQAVYRATGSPAGPVHLNCMFREPLVPDGPTAYAEGLDSWRGQSKPFTSYAAKKTLPEEQDVQQLAAQMQSARGLIVAGPLKNASEAVAVQKLAARLGWPLVPDVLSGLRLGSSKNATAVAFYDQVLGSEAFQQQMAPDVVLHFGGRPTSKRLLHFLSRHRPEVYAAVQSGPSRYDPSHQVTHRFEAATAAFCKMLAPNVQQTSSDYLQRWRAASDAVEAVIAQQLDTATLSEPGVARLIAQHIPAGHGLVLASSMPVRDADMFASPGGAAVPTAANRGASGIDGLVATAAGFAAGRAAPATLLIGDLALLHDLNSLALLRKHPVIVVVVNNDGGGIFHFLPVAQQQQVFEPFFGTPHGMTFEHAAWQFGLAYHQPQDATVFAEIYQKICAEAASAIIEVLTERTANHALHTELLPRCRAAVEALLER